MQSASLAGLLADDHTGVVVVNIGRNDINDQSSPILTTMDFLINSCRNFQSLLTPEIAPL